MKFTRKKRIFSNDESLEKLSCHHDSTLGKAIKRVAREMDAIHSFIVRQSNKFKTKSFKSFQSNFSTMDLQRLNEIFNQIQLNKSKRLQVISERFSLVIVKSVK